MQKYAEDTKLKQFLTTLNPLAYATDTLKTSLLPKLSDNKDVNDMLYNTIGTTISGDTLAFLVIAANHRLRKRKWEKKSKEITKSKLNTLHPISTPNYDPSNVGDIRRVRNLGMDGLEKSATDRGFWNKVLIGSVPMVTLTTLTALAPKYLNKVLSDTDKGDLDRQIEEKRNILEALHAKAIDLGLEKQSNDPFSGAIAGTLGITAALASPVLGITAYQFLKKRDEHEKMVKTMEDVAGENLTNIPQKISIQLANGRPSEDQGDMKYLERLEDEVKGARSVKKKETAKELFEASEKLIEAPKSKSTLAEITPMLEDFDDKVTKLEKEDLFA
jgi:hypothetical protein